MLDQTDGGDFCDVLWVRFRSVDEAKSAKKRWDDSPFYAHPLHITYAPEYVHPCSHAARYGSLLYLITIFCVSRSPFSDSSLSTHSDQHRHYKLLNKTRSRSFCADLHCDHAFSAERRYETEAETWEKLQRRRMAIAARLVEIGTSHEHVPERGKRPRHVDRQRTVLKPIATDQLRFMAPSQPLTVPAAPAPPAPPAPRVPFDGTPDSSSAEVRERLRRLNDGAPMPEVVAPPAKKAAKRTDRVRI